MVLIVTTQLFPAGDGLPTDHHYVHPSLPGLSMSIIFITLLMLFWSWSMVIILMLVMGFLMVVLFVGAWDGKFAGHPRRMVSHLLPIYTVTTPYICHTLIAIFWLIAVFWLVAIYWLIAIHWLPYIDFPSIAGLGFWQWQRCLQSSR